MCKDLVLAYHDLHLPYVLHTDASNKAIGAVLSQVLDGEEKVIMHGSKNILRVTMMMVYNNKRTFFYNSFVTVKFFYYLLNQEFTLRTDHLSLRWLDSFHDKETDMLA